MALYLVTGRSGTGKTAYCLEESRKHPSILIVPEQYSFHVGKELLKKDEVTGFTGGEVYSFRRLAQLLSDEVGGRTRRALSETEQAILFRSLMLRHSSEMQVLHGKQSDVSVISTLISELKSYDVTPEQLRSAITDQPDCLLVRKVHDVLLLYEAYEALDKMDAQDQISLLAENILQSDTIAERHIYIDQFTGFVPSELDCIRSLISHAQNVTITLTADSGSNEAPFQMVKKTKNALIRLAKEAGVSWEEIRMETEYRYQNHPELSHLEAHYFKLPVLPYPEQTESLSLYIAKNRYDEIEYVAREICRLVREESVRYRDIAIIARNGEDYQSKLNSVLKRYDIPYFMDRKMPMNQHPVVTFLLSALDVICGSWSYESMFRYLKCGLLDLDENELDELENYCLATGVRGSTWYREDAWDMNTVLYQEQAEEPNQERMERLDALRRRVAAPLVHLHDRIRRRHSLSEDVEALYDFLVEVGLPERVEACAEAFRVEGDLRRAGEYAQVFRILMEVFDTLHDTLGEESVSPKTFYELLETGLSQPHIGSIPQSMDHVSVSDITRAKGSGARIVFLVGVNDGVFPAAGGNEGFFNDANRHQFEEWGISLAPDSRGQALMEQNLIYSVFTMASDRLYLSYALSEGDTTYHPSQIVRNLKKMFPRLTVTDNLVQEAEPMQQIQSASGSFLPMVTALRTGMDFRNTPEEWRKAWDWYRTDEAWKEKAQALPKLFGYSAESTRLSEETVNRLYGDHLVTSVSRLETYQNCPFSFFVQYGLRAKERNIPKLGATDVGSFLHHIMDAFSRRLMDEGIAWRDVSDAMLNEYLEPILQQTYADMNPYMLAHSARYAFLVMQLRRILKTALTVVRDHMKAGLFEPLGYEMTFGKDGELKPLTVRLPGSNRTITLTGKIDRADILRTEEGSFVRIIDYKSGTKDFHVGDVYYGLSMQLGVYMAALCEQELPGNPSPVKPAGMLYFRLTDPTNVDGNLTEEEIRSEVRKQMKLRGLLLNQPEITEAMDMDCERWSEYFSFQRTKNGYSGNDLATMEQFDLLMRHLKRTIGKIGKEMMEGSTALSPRMKDNKTPCSYCSYRAVCGFDDKIDECRYNEMQKLTNAEAWERMEAEQCD